MPKPSVTIENWGVIQSVISPSFEGLHSGRRLTGYVMGHARISNTQRVFTSPIVAVDLNQGVVETVNTMYRLGEVSDEYKTWAHKRRTAIAA